MRLNFNKFVRLLNGGNDDSGSVLKIVFNYIDVTLSNSDQ